MSQSFNHDIVLAVNRFQAMIDVSPKTEMSLRSVTYARLGVVLPSGFPSLTMPHSPGSKSAAYNWYRNLELREV